MGERRESGPGQAKPAGAGKQGYPGRDLGLPAAGAGSLAGIGRRLGALLIDWQLCLLIAWAFIRSPGWTIVVFAAEDYLLTALAGITVGKRLMGIRVIRAGGGRVGPGWALVRTLLLLTAVPALLMDRDLRGLHDRAANTVVVRT